MEKRTLLEIVNDVATSLDYETVSDIGETPESERIVRIARMCYMEIMSKEDWPHLKVVTRLESLSDPTKPFMLKIPTDLAEIHTIRYETTPDGSDRKTWQTIEYLPFPNDFLDKVLTRDTSRDEIEVYETEEGISIPVYIDRFPSFCTTFDDVHLVFDAFNEDVDSTLQNSKTVVNGISSKGWVNSNTFVPDMPARMFPLYEAKVRVKANEYLRQVRLSEDLYETRSGFNRLRRKTRVSEENRKPRYGRRTR